jgi:putative membrane protein
MIKRTVYLVAVMLLVLLFPFSVMAEEMPIRPVQEVLSEIKQEQGVASNEQIDVAKISPEKLEELGDSVMEELIGNHAMHERMDARLGGEGSAALADYHKTLATNYLTGAPLGMMGMMWGGSRGSIRGSSPQTGINGRIGNNMMGYGWSGIGWIGAFLMGLVFLVVIALIVILVVRMSHGAARSATNHGAGQQSDSSARALDILSERYAKGELNDEEYAKKKAELRK